jgi:hypothetical protein
VRGASVARRTYRSGLIAEHWRSQLALRRIEILRRDHPDSFVVVHGDRIGDDLASWHTGSRLIPAIVPERPAVPDISVRSLSPTLTRSSKAKLSGDLYLDGELQDRARTKFS